MIALPRIMLFDRMIIRSANATEPKPRLATTIAINPDERRGHADGSEGGRSVAPGDMGGNLFHIANSVKTYNTALQGIDGSIPWMEGWTVCSVRRFWQEASDGFIGRRTPCEASKSLSLAILTVSDTRSIATDTSGALIIELAEAAGHRVVERAIVPDEPELMRRFSSSIVIEATSTPFS